MNCYCGNQQPYAECCEKLISGQETPTTAEALMRSRYSAFCIVNVDYLIETTDMQARFEIDRDANQAWAQKSQFTKLEILNTEENGNKAIVEFKAYFNLDNSVHTHHEISTFRKSNGRWYYRSGRIIATN